MEPDLRLDDGVDFDFYNNSDGKLLKTQHEQGWFNILPRLAEEIRIQAPPAGKNL